MSPRAPSPLVALVGNPNSGKTTLFNALTGMSARVGNYPGITVEHREGTLQLADGAQTRVLDLPGTYSVAPRSDDEVVAIQGLLGRLPGTKRPDVVVAVVDATHLDRNLYIVAQLRELPLRVVVALTMTDTLESDGHTIDVEALAARIGVPVVAAPAVAGGARALSALLGEVLRAQPPCPPLPPAFAPTADAHAELLALGEAVTVDLALPGAPIAVALWALLARAAGTLDKLGLDPQVERAVRESSVDDVAAAVVAARYARVSAWTSGVVRARPVHAGEAPSIRLTRRIDAIALHPVIGPVVLVGVFFTLFQALFTWSEPLMQLIEAGVQGASGLLGPLLPKDLPLLRSLVQDGVLAGVGNVIVFVPQIAVLFFFLGVLEDTGYLARAAFLLDRLMARVGLHGRAFVPLLSGFACAVPAILATRTIESQRDRLVTILVTPLISCSARLPVFALMIATVFSTLPPVFGVIAPGAIVMISMYTLSITAAVGMAAVFKRTILKSPIPPLVLELPPYRRPRAGPLFRSVTSRVWVFLTEAGTVILAITVVLWALFTFPRDPAIHQARDVAVQGIEATLPAGEARDAAIAAAEAEAGRKSLDHSIAGRLGHAIEPFIRPLGFDWKLGVGIIASFAAREVLVSTLGLVYGLGDGSDENSASLRDAMRADIDPRTGKPVHTPLSGLSLMVFFVLAMQCMSTLAAVRRETGSWRWPAFQLAYMTVLATTASLLVYQGGRLLGFA